MASIWNIGDNIADVDDTGALTVKDSSGTTILSVTASGVLVASNVGTPRMAVVAGGAAGDFTVSGIATGDVLTEVLYYAGAGSDVTDVSDLTSEFTITAANTINNTGGTASSSGKLVVRYQDLT